MSKIENYERVLINRRGKSYQLNVLLHWPPIDTYLVSVVQCAQFFATYTSIYTAFMLADIEVLDENDHRPQIDVEALGGGGGVAGGPSGPAFAGKVQLSVREGLPEGTRLAIVSVRDADSGHNGRVSCSVDRGTGTDTGTGIAEAVAVSSGVGSGRGVGAGGAARSDGRVARPAVAALQPMPFEHRFYLVTGAAFDRERLGVFEADAEARVSDEVALRFRIGTSFAFFLIYYCNGILQYYYTLLLSWLSRSKVFSISKQLIRN